MSYIYVNKLPQNMYPYLIILYLCAVFEQLALEYESLPLLWYLQHLNIYELSVTKCLHLLAAPSIR